MTTATPELGGGARELAAMSSFAGSEAVRLPFDLQRSRLFLAAVAAIAMAGAGAAVATRPVAGVGVVAALALLLAVALNERLGLILLAALVPATSGLARGFPVPGLRISEALVGGVATVLLLSARRVVRWGLLDWLALAYALATLALGSYDLLKRGAPFGSSNADALIGPFQFLLLYRAVRVTSPSPESRRLVIRCLLIASVPVALLAIGQQFNVPGFRSAVQTITGSDIYATTQGAAGRATGPFPHWHNLGGYLFVLILTGGALLMRRIDGILPRPAMAAILALDVTALIQTLSIAAFIGVILGALILGIWLGGASRTVLAVVIGGVAAVLLFGSALEARYGEQYSHAPETNQSSIVPQTVQYRYDIWTSDLLPLLHGRWLTGYGPDLPPQIQNFPYTESLYLGLLFRGGVILLAIYLALAVGWGLHSLSSLDDPDPLQRVLGAALATAMLMLVFMQFLESYWVDSGTPHVLWTLAALIPAGAFQTARLQTRHR